MSDVKNVTVQRYVNIDDCNYGKNIGDVGDVRFFRFLHC